MLKKLEQKSKNSQPLENNLTNSLMKLNANYKDNKKK